MCCDSSIKTSTDVNSEDRCEQRTSLSDVLWLNVRLYICSFVQFHYKQEGNYSIGSVGIVDVDCDFISSTYVSLCKHSFLLLT